MNDERVKLPCDRRVEREQQALLSSLIEHSDEVMPPRSISRSHSCDPRYHRGDLADREDIYGFTSKKREVSGGRTRSRNDLLHHGPGHHDPPSTPRRTDRTHRKADERFVEMVAHMKAAAPEQRLQFENFKARGARSTDRFMEHDMSPR
jgi:hypothetical protein